MTHRALQPPDWPKPRGYANGVLAEGRMVFVGGQVGWDETGAFVGEDFLSQAAQAMRNVMAVLAEAGAGAEHMVRLTWYVCDLKEYEAAQREVGEAYRSIFGRHYPAMTLIEVSRLAERQARVELEATAVL